MTARPQPATWNAVAVGALVACMVAAAPGSASADDAGWIERQRVKFKNRGLLEDAERALAGENYRDASGFFSEALKNDPDNLPIALRLIGVYDVLEQWQDGAELGDHIVTRHSGFSCGYLYHGYMAMKAGKRREARLSFMRIGNLESSAIADSPGEHGDPALPPSPNLSNLPQTYRALAEMCMEAEDYAHAASFGARWLEATSDAEAHILMAETSIRLEKWASALEHLDAAISAREDPADQGALRLKQGYVLTNLGDFDRAARALALARHGLTDRALIAQAESQLLENAMNRGRTYQKLEQHARARSIFENALKLPSSPGQNRAIRGLLAETLVHLGEHDLAIAEYAAVLEAAFDEDAALGYLRSLAAASKWAEAARAAEEYLARKDLSDSFSRRAREQLAELYLKLERHERAYDVARSLHKDFPDEPRYLQSLADAATRTGRTDEALTLYRQSLDKAFTAEGALGFHDLLKEASRAEESAEVLTRALALPGLREETRQAATYELAGAQLALGRTNDYLKTVRKIAEGDAPPVVLYECASQLLRMGERSLAIAAFERGLAKDDDQARRIDTAGIIANAYLDRGEAVLARQWFEKAASFGDVELPWHVDIARLDYEEGRYHAVVSRLHGYDVTDPDTDFLMGAALYHVGLKGPALFHLMRVSERSVLTKDEQHELLTMRARLQLGQDNYDAALAEAEAAIAIRYTPNMSVVGIKALHAAGRNHEARDTGAQLLPVFRREVTDSELKSRFFGTLARVHFALEDDARAIRYCSEALAATPDSGPLLYLRARAYARKNDHQAAESSFLEAIERMKNVPPAPWGDLGFLYGRMGKYDLGTVALKTSLDAFPYDYDMKRELRSQYIERQRESGK